MNDAPPPHETRGARAPANGGKSRRWLGLVALSGLLAASLFPYVFWRRHWTLRASGKPRAEAADEAASAVASLSFALGALGRVEERMQAADPPLEPIDPPDPSEFASPTACVRSYLPDVDLVDGSLDFFCSEVDSWTIERTVDVRLAHRNGGAKHWTRLGRHSLAALAAMRAGCCVAPEPLTAVVPGLWCGILRDTVRAIGPAPTLSDVTGYESMMRCLAARGVRLPERWGGTSPEASQAAFEDFLRTARRRRKDGRGHSPTE